MKILLVVYDNEMYINVFPTGLGYIAAVLKKSGFDVEIYNQDLHHYPEEHLTRYLDKHHFDMVGLGTIGGYFQYKKLLKISEAVNKSKNRPFYVLGGHGPSPEPEYFLKKTGADAIVIGEGEETIVELAKALAAKRSINNLDGIAFMERGKAVVNQRRPLIKDLDLIPFPAYELFPMYFYRLLREPHCASGDFVAPMISGRGCSFRCAFCYRMDEGLRCRSTEGIIEEIKMLKTNYGITYISFFDELLISSIKRTTELCEGFIRAGLNIRWTCNGRLNYAKPKVLQLMKKAGCVFINYGIEALDDEVLRAMNKCLTVEQIVKGIEATLKEEISPGFNVIFGNIGDNKNTLQQAVDFLLKYDDGAQLRTIRPVTPYPGSPLYYYALKNGLLKDCADFYENKHINSDLLAVNFTDMSDKEFHKALYDANQKLIKNYFKNKTKTSLDEARRLYMELNVNFRGFRQT
jgi:radical SAM superfamily enzyme YgiQ (UPF0313 family)